MGKVVECLECGPLKRGDPINRKSTGHSWRWVCKCGRPLFYGEDFIETKDPTEIPWEFGESDNGKEDS